MTVEARKAKIAAAVAALPAAYAAATGTPVGSPQWERVESLGATVHRQGRLLAGKKRGG